MLKKLSYLLLAIVVVLSFSACKKKEAETKYPSGPINFIVNYGGGGSADLSARAISSVAEKILGQPITIVNKPGGQGTTGLTEVKNAKKDGHTIGMTAYSLFSVIPHMQEVPYNIDDFDFICGYGHYVYAIVVKGDSPYKNINDLVKAAEEKPLKFSTVGFPHVLAFKGLEKLTKAQFTYVPFSSGNEAVAAVAGGHVEACIQTVTETLPFIKSGQVRAIASPNPERLAILPDVPTLKEQGYDVAITSRVGIVVPKGVDPKRITILRETFKRACSDPEFQKTMEQIGLPVDYMNPEDFKQFMIDGYNNAKPVIKEMGLAKDDQK